MELNDSIIIPIIISVVELTKSVGLPKKFSALVSVLTGIIIGIFFLQPANVKLGIFKGVIYGLSASGLYSGTKNTYEQIKKIK